MVQTQEKVYPEACNEMTVACVYFGVLVVPAPLPLLQNGGLNGDFGGENSSKVRVADSSSRNQSNHPYGVITATRSKPGKLSRALVTRR
jgi:hypothetical protein